MRKKRRTQNNSSKEVTKKKIRKKKRSNKISLKSNLQHYSLEGNLLTRVALVVLRKPRLLQNMLTHWMMETMRIRWAGQRDKMERIRVKRLMQVIRSGLSTKPWRTSDQRK